MMHVDIDTVALLVAFVLRWIDSRVHRGQAALSSHDNQMSFDCECRATAQQEPETCQQSTPKEKRSCKQTAAYSPGAAVDHD